MEVADTIEFIRTETYSSHLAEQLMHIKPEKAFVDFTIRIGQDTWPCHRILLAANSPRMKRLLAANPLRDSVSLKSIPHEVMNKLLDYMYCGEFEIASEFLQKLVEACNFLQLLGLKQMCLEKIPTVINSENTLSWWKLAGKLKLQAIEGHCLTMILSSFCAISRRNEFLELSNDAVAKYLGHCSGKVDSDDLLDASMRWIRKDVATRLQFAENLLQRIQLYKCSVQSIEENMKIHANIIDSRQEIYNIFTKSLMHILKEQNVRRQRSKQPSDVNPTSIREVPNKIQFIRTESYSANLVEQFQRLKEEKIFTDFAVQIRGVALPCHRVLLAANSPFLKSKLTGNHPIATEGRITLNAIPLVVMEKILDYMYSGQLCVDSNMLQDLLEACIYLEMIDLKEMCLKKVPSVIDTRNVESWFQLAEKLNLQSIKDHCSRIKVSELLDLLQKEEFITLPSNEVATYLRHGFGKIDSDILLDATMKWIGEDLNRMQFAENLLNQIQLAKCSVQCMNENMDKYSDMLSSNLTLRHMLTESLLQIAKQTRLRKHRRSQRGKVITIHVVGGQNRGQINNKSWYLDSFDRFTEIATMQTPDYCELRVRHSVCKTVKGIAITGGDRSQLCVMYVASSNSYIKLQDLLQTRDAHGSIFVHGVLYVFGGYVSQRRSRSVDYLPDNGSWQRGPDMPVVCTYPKVASIGRKIYLLSEDNNSLHYLDIYPNRWSSRASLPGRICTGSSIASFHDKLYVAGGRDRLLAIYTPDEDAWCLAVGPSLLHEYGALVPLEDELYLLGGKFLDDSTDEVEQYNPEEENWSVCPFSMPVSLFQHYACVMPLRE